MSVEMEQALAAAEAAQRDSAESQVIPADTHSPYTDNLVEVPVGLVEPGVGLVDVVEVRELNGYDEEVINRSKSAGMAVQQILERAVVKVGDREFRKSDLTALTLPDRVEILIGIRAATWGTDIDWNFRCSDCGETSEVKVDVKDIPRKPLKDKLADRNFALTLPSGKHAVLQWPGGDLHAKNLRGDFKSNAELVTALITSCVQTIDDMPLLRGTESAREMSLRDRQFISNYVFDNLPGPALDETEATCPSCGERSTIGLSVGALFPG